MGREGSGSTDFVPLEFPDAGDAEAERGNTRRDVNGNGCERTWRYGRAERCPDTSSTQQSRRAPPPRPPPAGWGVCGAQGRDLPLQDHFVPGLGENGQAESSLSERRLLRRSARAPPPASSALARRPLPGPRPPTSLVLSVERGIPPESPSPAAPRLPRALPPAPAEPGCSLPDAAAPAAPQRGPTPSLPKPAGCATPLAARENPFLASASSSRILEHVSECITARSLIEIQLGDLALLPLHGQLLRGWQSEPGVTPDRDRDGDGDREGSSAAQPGASSTPGACTAGGCRLCPSSPGQQTLRCPSWRCPCPVPTLSRGTVALQGTRAPPPKPYSLHRCHPG